MEKLTPAQQQVVTNLDNIYRTAHRHARRRRLLALVAAGAIAAALVPVLSALGAEPELPGLELEQQQRSGSGRRRMR